MSKSIEINYLGDSGYEVLYPNTMLNSVLDWQENLYSKDEILDSATKVLYGLGEDSVPKDVLATIKQETTNMDNRAVHVEFGNYYGDGAISKTIYTDEQPFMIAITANSSVFSGTGSGTVTVTTDFSWIRTVTSGAGFNYCFSRSGGGFEGNYVGLFNLT